MEPASFSKMLDAIFELTKTQNSIQIRDLFTVLKGKGYAVLLVVFSLPCALPIQIPGFSAVFGLILTFLGLRLIFSKNLWWPEWILKKKLSSRSVQIVLEKIRKICRIVRRGARPRLPGLVSSPFSRILNGLLVTSLALFLSLPLPIPLSNMLAALPILFLGLGILEEDGVIILFSYFLFVMGIFAAIALFIFGFEQLRQVLDK